MVLSYWFPSPAALPGMSMPGIMLGMMSGMVKS
jgi:hypothetical protein